MGDEPKDELTVLGARLILLVCKLVGFENAELDSGDVTWSKLFPALTLNAKAPAVAVPLLVGVAVWD